MPTSRSRSAEHVTDGRHDARAPSPTCRRSRRAASELDARDRPLLVRRRALRDGDRRRCRFRARRRSRMFEALLTRTAARRRRASNPSLPAEFDRIIAKALEKDPRPALPDRRRPAQRSEAAAPCQRVADAVPVSALLRRARHRPRRRRWKLTAGGRQRRSRSSAIAGVFLYSSRTRAFSERDTVVHRRLRQHAPASRCSTDTLKEALDVQLRQSPFLTSSRSSVSRARCG